MKLIGKLVLEVLVDLHKRLLILLNNVCEYFENFERQFLYLLGQDYLECFGQNLNEVVGRSGAKYTIIMHKLILL